MSYSFVNGQLYDPGDAAGDARFSDQEMRAREAESSKYDVYPYNQLDSDNAQLDSNNNYNLNNVSNYEEIYWEQQKQKDEAYQEYLVQQRKEYLLDITNDQQSCPPYSYLYNDNCYCYNWYGWNSNKTSCILMKSKTQSQIYTPKSITQNNAPKNNIEEINNFQNECEFKNGIWSISGVGGCVCKEWYESYSENGKLKCRSIGNKIIIIIGDTIKSISTFDDVRDYMILWRIVFIVISIINSFIKKE